MTHYCANCGSVIELPSSGTVGRRESCARCSADLHSCVQCTFYDPSAYNECREPQADRVVEKDRSNFCDYFRLAEGRKPKDGSKDPKSEALKKLDDLFK